MIVHGFDILPTDLFSSVYEVQGSELQIVKTHRGGWQARRTPVGRERTALLTPPCDRPGDAVLLLIRKGHLTKPPETCVPLRAQTSWMMPPTDHVMVMVMER